MQITQIIFFTTQTINILFEFDSLMMNLVYFETSETQRSLLRAPWSENMNFNVKALLFLIE